MLKDYKNSNNSFESSGDKERLSIPPDDLSYGQVRLKFVRIVPGDPSRGTVMNYHFRIITADDQDAGHLNFKAGDTEHVRLYAGHIGFEISEPFRGQGLALQACRAIAPFVRTFYTEVILTCNPNNIASIRTIEKLGARFIEEVSVAESDPQYQSGSRRKKRYVWKP
jgi:predicted acetyltransferase